MPWMRRAESRSVAGRTQARTPASAARSATCGQSSEYSLLSKCTWESTSLKEFGNKGESWVNRFIFSTLVKEGPGPTRQKWHLSVYRGDPGVPGAKNRLR